MSSIASILRQRNIRARTAKIRKTTPAATLPSINRNATSTFIRNLKIVKPLPQTPPDITLPSLGNKIPKSILNKYKMPTGTITEINTDLTIVKLNNQTRKSIIKQLNELNKDDITKGVIVCREGIGEGFMNMTLNNKKMKGFIIKNKKKVIGFMFYRIGSKKENKDKMKVDLVCANKGRGKLKGMPLGKIMFDILELQAKKNLNKIKKIKLESVPNPDTVNFYKSIGFKKTNETASELSLIVMVKTL